MGSRDQSRPSGFYRELSARFARRGMADVSILRIGGRDAAYMIGIAERGIYYDNHRVVP